MTHKKKQFQKPMLRLVAMESVGIMAASGEGPAPASITTEKMTEGGSISWSATGMQ